MTSSEPRRLGIHPLLPDADVRNGRERESRFTIEIKFDRLLEIGDRLFLRRAEAGHIHVETFRDMKLFFAIDAVGDAFHGQRVLDVEASFKASLRDLRRKGA